MRPTGEMRPVSRPRVEFPCHSAAGGVLFRCRQVRPNRIQVADPKYIFGGASSGAEERFLPALREMPTTNDRRRLAIHRLGRSAREMPGRIKIALLRVLVRDHARLRRPADREARVVPEAAAQDKDRYFRDIQCRPPSHRPGPPAPSGAGFVTKPPTSQGWRPTVSVVINRDQTDAEQPWAATDPLRRTARYAPRAGIGKVPTLAEREASPCAKPG